MISLFITVVLIVGYVALMTYGSKIGREELEKFSLLLDSALKYPISARILSDLISVWKETRLTSSNLEFYFEHKYIERTFRVCEMNFTNLYTWDLLEIVIKKPLVISPDLIEAAKAHPFALRFTATHDLFHILLGFDTSYAGEIGVLGFTIGQGYSKFLNAYEGVVKHIYPLILPSQAQQIRANLARGKAIGEQAQCLLVYPFEENWSRPIEDLRAELGLVLDNQQFDTQSGSLTGDRTTDIVTA